MKSRGEERKGVQSKWKQASRGDGMECQKRINQIIYDKTKESIIYSNIRQSIISILLQIIIKYPMGQNENAGKKRTKKEKLRKVNEANKKVQQIRE